jgi:triphosphoribosyl-dephospho-CoA synthase
VGVPQLAAARVAGWPEPWAVTATFMAFLAGFPDTHVERKHGAVVARALRERAGPLAAALRSSPDPAAMVPALLALDAELKDRGVNPGTSADLTVASHFAAALEPPGRC